MKANKKRSFMVSKFKQEKKIRYKKSHFQIKKYDK